MLNRELRVTFGSSGFAKRHGKDNPGSLPALAQDGYFRANLFRTLAHSDHSEVPRCGRPIVGRETDSVVFDEKGQHFVRRGEAKGQALGTGVPNRVHDSLSSNPEDLELQFRREERIYRIELESE